MLVYVNIVQSRVRDSLIVQNEASDSAKSENLSESEEVEIGSSEQDEVKQEDTSQRKRIRKPVERLIKLQRVAEQAAQDTLPLSPILWSKIFSYLDLPEWSSLIFVCKGFLNLLPWECVTELSLGHMSDRDKLDKMLTVIITRASVCA
jgi:hypothetical protein